MSSPLTVVIHHSADYDGIFCRQIARKRFGDDDSEVRYIGWDYGDPVPEVSRTDKLFMLDISIDALMDHPHLTWIDHHKTAIEKFGARNGIQIDGVAACRLAWQWFFGDSSSLQKACVKELFIDRRFDEPLAVRLAGEYDIWDKRDPRADTFQHGLKGGDLTPTSWAYMLSLGTDGERVVKRLLDDGATVQRAKQKEDASIIKSRGFTVDFEDKRFLALCTPRCNSLSFIAGIEQEHDGCIGFNWDGKKWNVSLYGVPHKPDEDFTPIATKYGGGGHKQACGFQIHPSKWGAFQLTHLPFLGGCAVE